MPGAMRIGVRPEPSSPGPPQCGHCAWNCGRSYNLLSTDAPIRNAARLNGEPSPVWRHQIILRDRSQVQALVQRRREFLHPAVADVHRLVTAAVLSRPQQPLAGGATEAGTVADRAPSRGAAAAA